MQIIVQYSEYTILVSCSQTTFSSFIFGQEEKGSGECPL